MESATQEQAVPVRDRDMRVVPPKQVSAGSKQLISQIASREFDTAQTAVSDTTSLQPARCGEACADRELLVVI